MRASVTSLYTSVIIRKQQGIHIYTVKVLCIYEYVYIYIYIYIYNYIYINIYITNLAQKRVSNCT